MKYNRLLSLNPGRILNELIALTGCVVVLLWSMVSHAQINMAKHETNVPIEVTSDRLELVRNEQQAVFSGNVVATQGTLQLLSETITVYYHESVKGNEPGKQSSITKIIADNNVTIKTPSEEVVADYGIYDVDKKVITLKKNVVLKQGKNLVRGSKLVYNLATGISQLINEPNIENKSGRVRGVFVPSRKIDDQNSVQNTIKQDVPAISTTPADKPTE